jgi:predicted amidohydrolase YtcJ
MIQDCAGCFSPGRAMLHELISHPALLRASAVLSGAGAPGATTARRGAGVRGRRPAAGPADTIFWGGPIVTVNGPRAEVEALAVRGGRIVALGDASAVRAQQGPDTTMVALEGRTVLPGFVEAHLHTLNGALSAQYLDVTPFTTSSHTEAMQKVKAAVDGAQPGAWVVAWGYDPTLIAGPPTITTQDLDPFSPHNPVLIVNLSTHIAYVNSQTFAAVGVTRDSPDPPGGGRFVRDANGDLTGQINEPPALRPFVAKIPPPPPEQIVELTQRFLRGIAATGCTTITDAGVGSTAGTPELPLLQRIFHLPDCPVRFRGFPSGPFLEQFQAMPGFGPMMGDDLFRLVKIKFVGDGSTQGFTAALKQPYLHETGTGQLDESFEALRDQMQRAIALGWSLAVHCNGDAALDQALDIFEALQGTSPQPDRRHRIEHFTVNDERQVERADGLGLTPSFTIGHVHYWGKVFRDEILGAARAERIDPAASWLRRGRPFSLNSDSITTPIGPLGYIQTAVTRRMRDGGEVLGPEQCIPVDEAIKAVTLYPAWQVHMDDVAGSLEVGKYADLVILDQNPRAVDPDAIASIKVLETWMDGSRRYQA